MCVEYSEHFRDILSDMVSACSMIEKENKFARQDLSSKISHYGARSNEKRTKKILDPDTKRQGFVTKTFRKFSQF